MDSILSAYSKVFTDEKMCLQILISPLDEKELKALRKESKRIKEGKNKSFIGMLFKDIRRGIIGANSDSKDAPKDEEKKSDLSQQQSGDLDKKVDDEIFSVKIRALVTSPDPHRPERIIEDLARGFSQYNYIGLNAFKFKKSKKLNEFAKEFINRIFLSDNGFVSNLNGWSKKMILSMKELSSIMHIPNAKFNRSPRISRQKRAAPLNPAQKGYS